MKIAIAKTGNEAAEHFGHCDSFMIYEVEDGNILKETSLANPGHEPGVLPVFLKEQGVNVVIAGGMGSRAMQLFAANNIQTITGLSGTVKDVLTSYLNNTLVGTNESCKHHDENECEHQ